MSVSYAKLIEFAGQAEKEGVTLGEFLMRRLSPEELDLAQAELAVDITDSYVGIEEFMSDVEVPSIDEMTSMGYEKELEELS